MAFQIKAALPEKFKNPAKMLLKNRELFTNNSMIELWNGAIEIR
jgi:hypothetical protein